MPSNPVMVGNEKISTRRRAPSGVVHEMADRGTGTLCGRDLPEPWVWVDDPTTCRKCLAREERDAK